MLYPRNFEEKVGFDKVREKLRTACLSSMGRDKVDAIRFSRSFEFIKTCLHQVDEFKHICLFEDDFPVSHYIDVRRFLKKIEVENTHLEVNEIFDLKRSLEAIKSILRFFEKQKEGDYPYLRQITGDVKVYPVVLERINMIINKHGAIKDNASPELAQIRRSILQKQSTISKISNNILSKAKGEGWVDDEASISIRDGRMLIPVPAAYKRKIKGYVYDESATGKTSYIEPVEIIEANNEIRELEFAERREIMRILAEFTELLRPYIDDLKQSYEFLGEIDFIRAKARFAIDVEGVKPELHNNTITDLRAAKHPLLLLTFKREGKKVVPLDIEINRKQKIILISGPNAGGKSVCLKTVGLLQYMVQCGLLVPVNQTSKIGIYNKIFIDIGDEQSLENDLSTYSSHLKNMKFFVEKADARTLFLIDEFGTGTEPLIGGAIAESVLEQLSSRNAFGVLTTHYTNLKHYAASDANIANAAMLFDSKNMQPLFQLEIGQPGSSYAFEIAKKIGLPGKILRKAEQKVGKGHIDYDKNLRELERDRRVVNKQKEKLEKLENQLEESIDKYHRETDYSIRQRRNILNITHEQARDILSNVNKRIENTISEIKHANAEKEKTKEARKKLEAQLKEEKEKWKREEEKINAKIEKIEKRKKKRKKKNTEGKPLEEEIIDKEIRIGDNVKLKKQDAVGEIIDLKDNEAVIAFGSLHTIVKKDRLEKVSNNEAKRLEKKTAGTINTLGWDLSERKSNFIFGLDVRGKRVDEALGRVMEYIDEAIVVEAKEIKILHGTGTGALKQAIRDYLRTVDLVKSVRDERIELGGAGVSIVELDF